jgi:hypothetical protein
MGRCSNTNKQPSISINLEQEQVEEQQAVVVVQQNIEQQEKDLPDWRRYCAVCRRCSTQQNPLLFSTVTIITKKPTPSTSDA